MHNVSSIRLYAYYNTRRAVLFSSVKQNEHSVSIVYLYFFIPSHTFQPSGKNTKSANPIFESEPARVCVRIRTNDCTRDTRATEHAMFPGNWHYYFNIIIIVSRNTPNDSGNALPDGYGRPGIRRHSTRGTARTHTCPRDIVSVFFFFFFIRLYAINCFYLPPVQ